MNTKEISQLRAQAHHLKPVVMIGNAGLSDSVQKEIEVALKAHSLIKIQVAGDDRAARQAMLTEICSLTGATAIHLIGKQLVIFRPAEKT